MNNVRGRGMVYKIVNDRITGIPNLEFTPEDASYLGAVIGSWYGANSIVVSGRDYNPSSRMLKRAFISGLMSVGVEVMDFHESVAGEISYSIKRFGARGGFIVVSNPVLMDHVMFKIFTNPGIEIVGDKLSIILSKKDIRRVDPHNTGWVSYAEYIHRLYISALSSFIAYDRIMEKKFKVVVDVNHGPADKIIPELLSYLGVDFILINASKPSKKEQYTYPYISNIREISNIVRSTNADMGLIFNNDASSFLLLDENGKPLIPEEVLLLHSLRIPKEAEVMYTSECFGFVNDLLLMRNIKAYRIKGSIADFLSKIAEKRPIIGLDCMGGTIHPLFNLGFDAILGFLKVLEALAYTDKKVSEVIKYHMYPKYYVVETGIDLGEVAGSICREGIGECKPYIGGYRVKIQSSNVVLTHDPIDDVTKILVDIKSPNIGKILETIQGVLSTKKA